MTQFTDRLLYRHLRVTPTRRPFVFGIGLSKTGTTSLNDALTILGHKAYHLPPVTRVAGDTITFDPAWWTYKYDAWTDLPVAMVCAELWRRFPNARFVYTPRDKQGWLRSCERHFVPGLLENRVRSGDLWLLQLRLATFGTLQFDRALYAAAYDRHERAVLALMQGSPRFLSLDITGGAGWEPLCRFLGKPVPQQPFPVSNRQSPPAPPFGIDNPRAEDGHTAET